MTGNSQTSWSVHLSIGSLRIMPLIVTSSSRLGPRAGAKSISRDDRELSEEIDVPDGERGIEVSAAAAKPE